MPKREVERTSLSFGSPEIACSKGAETWRSISSGERAGATVFTWTWTGVVSGKASRGSLKKASIPSTATTDQVTMTTRRWLRDQLIILFSITLSYFGIAGTKIFIFTHQKQALLSGDATTQRESNTGSSLVYTVKKTLPFVASLRRRVRRVLTYILPRLKSQGTTCCPLRNSPLRWSP